MGTGGFLPILCDKACLLVPMLKIGIQTLSFYNFRGIVRIEQLETILMLGAVFSPPAAQCADRYDMALNSKENIVPVRGHQGRHTNVYHEFMMCTLISLDYLAAGSKTLFYQGMEITAEFIANNPGLPYAK